MASIDICYAVAAYNLVSEEHLHFYFMESSFRTAADDVKNRLRCCLTVSEAIAAPTA
jgi:hypothetical protein